MSTVHPSERLWRMMNRLEQKKWYARNKSPSHPILHYVSAVNASRSNFFNADSPIFTHNYEPDGYVDWTTAVAWIIGKSYGKGQLVGLGNQLHAYLCIRHCHSFILGLVYVCIKSYTYVYTYNVVYIVRVYTTWWVYVHSLDESISLD